jgi:hypothetical protein
MSDLTIAALGRERDRCSFGSADLDSVHEGGVAQLPVVPEIPEGITYVKVDPTTGLLESEPEGDGEKGSVELFAKGSEPTQSAARRLGPTDFYKLDQIPEGGPVGEGITSP